MTGAASASSLITPDLRRRLQQRYEEAQRLATAPKADYQRIHDLLAECLRADPGSVLYLDAFWANLQRWQPRSRLSWLSRWFSKPAIANDSRRKAGGQPNVLSAQYSVLSTQYSLLRTAPDLLRDNPSDADLLNQLADAASAYDLEQAELRYRQLAADIAPQDSEVLRRLAQTLTRQGRFSDATEAWGRLIQALPQDAECLQALADLGSQQEDFDQTEQTLADAQAAGAPLLQSLEKREQLQLDRSERRLEIARQLASHDAHPQAQALVARFDAERRRMEIEILHLRCERLPQDWRLRVELARQQKLAGNFSGAIQRLEEADQLKLEYPIVLMELGECWQHLRQFTKALDYYRRATAAADRLMETGSSENLEAAKLARYRVGVLAAAMGENDEARTSLTALVAMDPDFKDAEQRLDNLRPN